MQGSPKSLQPTHSFLYFFICSLKLPTQSKVKEHLENDEWVKISTGNGTKGEKVFEWQYTEVNCNIENHRKYLIFRRSLSDNSQIRGYIAYGNCETKIEEFVRTAGI